MIMGQEIRCANVKVTYDKADEKPEIAIFLIGAVPLKKFNNALHSMQGRGLNITKFNVGGETYAVGLEFVTIANSA